MVLACQAIPNQRRMTHRSAKLGADGSKDHKRYSTHRNAYPRAGRISAARVTSEMNSLRR